MTEHTIHEDWGSFLFFIKISPFSWSIVRRQGGELHRIIVQIYPILFYNSIMTNPVSAREPCDARRWMEGSNREGIS
jgi:hypothetical protein